MVQGRNHLETLLLALQAASGEQSLEQRKRVAGYVKHAEPETVVKSIKQIRDRRLLRQLMGVGVQGGANRALNARLFELGG